MDLGCTSEIKLILVSNRSIRLIKKVKLVLTIKKDMLKLKMHLKIRRTLILWLEFWLIKLKSRNLFFIDYSLSNVNNFDLL